MLYSFLLIALQILGLTSFVAAGGNRPACVQKCWENTKYVSPECGSKISCLCDDTEYQNAVYQCLYSQCHTAQFANALHHTLAMCSADKEKAKSKKAGKGFSVPALLRQNQQFKKRQNKPNMSVSASASVTRPTMSVTRSAGQSVSRPTQSVTRSAPQQSVSASNYMRRHIGRAFPTAA